ncbi:hypothetical protein DICVIV_11301 [Dictyocaulus viviparus]|uniref:C2 DOCK-type domain-containing protein n=1 Tax=Dictyocaulus viviparus TaxID=29172 RepID=A0A0D8XDN4_DICVI|nr:hypothetical protein DICVIV_11301 [Dictyocaulus viviparus]
MIVQSYEKPHTQSLMFGRVAQEDRRSDISESSGTSTLIRDGVVSIKSGGSQFRKFTANVGRLGVAREAREAVRNVISTHNISLQISSTEPLDYEKFITEKAIQLENDPQRELVMFPRDDLEELVEAMPSRTVVPMVSENDITESAWLLTRDAVKNYIKPKHAIIFNYEKFSGDYDNLYEEQKDVDYLSSLVLESDMVLEEEKANSETSFTDIVKEGYVMLFKTDPGLLDNFKWAKKRYCTVKCLPSGEIGIGISKSRDCPPKHPYMTVHSTQLRSTRKGRTVLEIESSYSATQPRIFLLGFEEEEDLSSWFHLLQRAITVVSKDSISHTLQHQEDSDKMLSDADSCSTTGIDGAWRGQKATTRALQPPIVERKNIFSLFHKLCPLPKPICEPCSVFNRCSILNTHIVNCCQNPVLRFLVAFIKLNLKLDVAPGVSQQIEPFYISIFFYDVSQGKRASEEFQLYRNETEEESDQDHKASDDLTKNFGVSREQLISRAANQVVFTTNRPLKDLWVVCRIDRMLSLDHSGDVYMKSSSDIKAVLKLQKLVQSSQSRLSEYRQRFAWAARPLHKTVSSEDTTASNSGNCVSMQIFRCENGRLTDLDIQKYLGDFTKMTRTGKFIIPNAGVEMKIEQIRSTEILEARVNSSLYALAPWKLPNDCCEPPVFELQAFDNVLPEPHSQFVNLLYVYPLSLKYDSQRIFSKARNILCSVRLVQGGNLSSAKVFFNRVHPSGPFVTSGKCAVQYHQQFPQFGDEIKIRLPLCLSSSDHLLFSFSHISVAEQTNGKSNESVESAIGYSWLPLVWKKDQLVMENDEEEFALPVAVDLPSTYFLSGPFREDNSDIKWVDQRPLFRLRVRLVSSVFTSEPDLQNFFQAFGRLKCGNVVENATFPTIVTTSTPSTKCTVRSCSPLMSSCSSDEESLTIRSILACMEALVMIDIKKIIPYLYVFLSRLLELVAYASTEKLAVSTLRSG